MSDNANKGEWFLEKDGHIYGPLSVASIENLLIAREVTPLTPISDGTNNWKCIRDEPALAHALQKARESTKPEESNSLAKDFGEKTKLVGGVLDALKYAQNKEEFHAKLKIETPGRAARAGPAMAPIPTYRRRKLGWIQDSRLKATLLNSKALIIASVVFIVWALATFVFVQSQKLTDAQKDDANIVIEQSQHLLDSGMNDQAMNALDRVRPLFKSYDPLKVQEAKILLSQNNINDAAGELDAVTSNKGGSDSPTESPNGTCSDRCWAEANNLMGVIALLKSQLGESMQFVQAALKAAPDYVPALFNLGTLNLLGDNPAAATPSFSAAFNQGSRDGAIVLALADSAISANDRAPNRDLLAKTDGTLDLFLRQSRDERQEVLIARATLNLLMGQISDSQKWIDEALDSDPMLNQSEIHDVRLYREKVQWQTVMNWCARLTANLPPSPRLAIFNAFCIYQSGDRAQGLEAVKTAVQESRDALDWAIFSLIARSGNQVADADGALKWAVTAPQYKLPLILKIENCGEDGNCGYEEAVTLLNRDPANPLGRYTTALALSKKGDSPGALSEIAKGLAFAPNYGPLLRLQLQLKH